MKKLIFLLLTTLLYSNESCLNCHKDTSDIDSFHKIKDMGCASCHGGNSNATLKEKAHKNMVLNPARLEHAKIFCAKCHKDIVNRVSKSIMNTQSGILGVLKYQFKETKSIVKTKGIKELKNKPTSKQSLAESHFSKLCAACHINQKEEDFKNIAKRGGGCMDCHRESENINKLSFTDTHFHGYDSNFSLSTPNATPPLFPRKRESKEHYNTLKPYKHQKFTTRIKNETCLKCHNRSNRIGLSYIGKFESEGYNHFKDGKVDNKLDIHRNFYKLPADIHHSSSKLSCIDCHTEVGVMGDGKEHKHMESAVDISCSDCHNPKFVDANSQPLAIKLAFINGKVPIPKDKVAITKRKNTPLYNLQKVDNNITLYRKSDGKAVDLPLLKGSYHSHSFHKRLDCSACHSQWIPSCYGCHEVYIENGKQFDWIKHKKTKGQWQELRSYLRYEDNTLAIGYNGKIMPSAPGCQVIMNIYDKNGSYNHKFDSLAYGAWSPHTIGKSKKCKDCHNTSSTIGVGQGIMQIKKDKISFKPYFNSQKSGFNFKFNIDALNDINGTQNQSFSRDKARAFNKQEINKITNAYKCIICHDTYSDKIYKDFNKSKKMFYNKKTKCAKEILIK